MSEEQNDAGLPHGFEPAETFDEFFRLNEERIHDMMRADQYELLYAVWFGGYDYGLRAMGELINPLWSGRGG